MKKIKKIFDAFEENQKENKTKKKTKIKEFILTQLFDIRKKRKQELCEEKTECKDGECSKEYAQLAEWLKELKYYRKQKQKAMNQWALS